MPTKENLQMSDGSQAIFEVFEADGPVRAVMLVCHGFGEYIHLYSRAARFFNAHGLTLCIHDQRSFGEGVLSRKRHRNITESYSLFLDDIDVVYATIQQRFPGLPVILFGHSMGGNIALSYLFSRRQDMFSMAIIETPWLRLRTPLGKRALVLAGRMRQDEQPTIYKSRGNYKRRHSRADEGYSRQSLRLIAAISDVGEGLVNRAAEVRIPALLLSAERDGVVSTPAIDEFYSHANENMQYICIEGGRHALHTDRPAIRNLAFETMLTFITDNL